MGKARDISKLFSADTVLVTQTELTSALQNVTVDLSGYATASAVSASIANIDVTSSLDSRIYINSASPTLENTNGRLWIDTSTASAPVMTVFGSNSFRTPSFSRFSATGGTITKYGEYTVHTFTGTSSFIVNSGTRQIDYLLIAGGGGGAGTGGGGGAGGLVQGTMTMNPGTYSVQIGGGAGGAGWPNTGGTGINSTFNGVTANGGGGGPHASNGIGGGSGGGAGYGGSGGIGIAGQGSNGGSASQVDPGYPGAGGGGAGSVGSSNSGQNGGNGGSGLLSTINGSSNYYAGGGGGGTRGYTPGGGGIGGGGNGSSSGNGSNGTANTGGGGGSAGGTTSGVGGTGGSGILIIRYLT